MKMDAERKRARKTIGGVGLGMENESQSVRRLKIERGISRGELESQ